jgi:hypothetical protein
MKSAVSNEGVEAKLTMCLRLPLPTVNELFASLPW